MSPVLSRTEPAAPLLPDVVSHHISCVLVKLGQVILRLMEQQLAELGLRCRHYTILQTLVHRGQASQQELGEFLRIDGATMVASIDDLQDLGYVSRERDAQDRRRNVVTATPAGRRMARRASALMDRLDGEIQHELGLPAAGELHRLGLALVNGAALPSALDALRGR